MSDQENPIERPAAPQAPVVIPPEIVATLNRAVELQAQTLGIQQQQLELNRLQIEKNVEYAHAALTADMGDRREERTHELKFSLATRYSSAF